MFDIAFPKMWSTIGFSPCSDITLEQEWNRLTSFFPSDIGGISMSFFSFSLFRSPEGPSDPLFMSQISSSPLVTQLLNEAKLVLSWLCCMHGYRQYDSFLLYKNPILMCGIKISFINLTTTKSINIFQLQGGCYPVRPPRPLCPPARPPPLHHLQPQSEGEGHTRQCYSEG